MFPDEDDEGDRPDGDPELPDPDGELADSGGSDDEEPYYEPLSGEERESVEADLEDLAGMRTAFEPQGAKGVVIACSDCGSNHFYGWDLLKESLEHMLETGEPRMHEPAYQPKEDDYVVWDYGKGYIDALADAGLQSGARVEVTACPWCESGVEPHFAFCPRCGRALAAFRLYRELLQRGMEEHEVRTLLLQAGYEPFGQDWGRTPA